jgi:hypothetical protein
MPLQPDAAHNHRHQTRPISTSPVAGFQHHQNPDGPHRTPPQALTAVIRRQGEKLSPDASPHLPPKDVQQHPDPTPALNRDSTLTFTTNAAPAITTNLEPLRLKPIIGSRASASFPDVVSSLQLLFAGSQQ